MSKLTSLAIAIGTLVLGLGLGGEALAASPKSVAVTVKELAGGHAYLVPGEASGVGAGALVVFGKQRYRVLSATRDYAVIALQGRELRIGMKGWAQTGQTTEAPATSLPKPEPLDAYQGQWQEPVLPATAQEVEYVPLGRIEGEKRVDFSLSVDGSGTIALGDGQSFGRAGLRTRLHAEPFAAPWFFDADLTFRSWFGGNLDDRPGRASRPLVVVRELQAGYGNEQTPQAALGRLPYVGAGVGLLDGARVRSPSWSGFSIGAFGGFVPDPLNGKPSNDTARFGVQLAYQNASLAARPMLGVSVHGSTFEGQIDERRVNAELDLFPGNARIAGHLELSMHDQDNPWLAPTLEVSAAGFDAAVRVGVFEIAGRFDRRLPERSLWLNAFLPPGYLCDTVPASPPNTANPVQCNGNGDARYFGGLDLSFNFKRWGLYAGSNVLHSEESRDFEQVAGYVQARVLRIADIAWVDLSGAVYARSFVDSYAGRLGAGVQIGQTAEVSVYYRPSLNQYDADPDTWLEHWAGGMVYWSFRDDMDFGLRADGIFGADVDVLLLQSSLTWRPSW